MANLSVATLGGGCFWCLEAVYDELAGVVSVESGYMGGHVANPDYRTVCTGRSGHVEVAQVTFDPAVISFGDILDVFFSIHDPTSVDRQGNDSGPQYRSAIFYRDEEQRAVAEEAIRERNAKGEGPIVTELRPAETFYKAEDYHQEYFQRNPEQPYCVYVVSPKVQKFRKKFRSRLRGAPAE